MRQWSIENWRYLRTGSHLNECDMEVKEIPAGRRWSRTDPCSPHATMSPSQAAFTPDCEWLGVQAIHSWGHSKTGRVLIRTRRSRRFLEGELAPERGGDPCDRHVRKWWMEAKWHLSEGSVLRGKIGRKLENTSWCCAAGQDVSRPTLWSNFKKLSSLRTPKDP